MFKALILDYSGVLYAKNKPASMHDFGAQIEARYGLPAGATRRASMGARSTLGEMMEDSKVLLAYVAGRIETEHNVKIEDLHGQWRAFRRAAKVDLTANAAIIRALCGQLRTAVLANSDGTVEERLRKQGIRHLFDVVIDSGKVDCEKPEARIYQLTAERLGVASGECIFVDDHEENVEGARAAGMTAIHFSYLRGDDLGQQLKALGVVVPEGVPAGGD